MKELDSMEIFTLDSIIGSKVPCMDIMDLCWKILAVGFIGSVLVTPIARRAAFQFKILDIPNETVKTHKKPTAYLGGIAVLAGFLAGIAAFYVLERPMSFNQVKILLAIGGGAILSCIVGLIDDIKDIRPWQKLLGQAVCSLFLIMALIKPSLYPFFGMVGIHLSPIIHDILAYFTVLFFVLGASNSLNLLDGLDGLCTGVTAIITGGFLFLAISLATWGSNSEIDLIRVSLSAALVGAAMGFLVYNRNPAKIFLGDAGSILLGFIIASLMLLFSVQNPRWLIASIMIFGLPILDTGTALIRRFLNKRPLFVSDRGHIYDQMMDRGIPLKRTVSINYLLAGLYAMIGILGACFLHARYALIVYVVVGIISFFIVGMKGYFRMEGMRGEVKKGAGRKKNVLENPASND
jgi:UDP-GlcNAc:undecaprenyl-phosphate/decaprenyl-phosphate GlcNAc-1-phosphate transferase